MTSKSTAVKTSNHPAFDMDDDDYFLELCPDPSPVTQTKTAVAALPSLSGTSDTSSVVMLTPATQEIVFIDDSIVDTHHPLNTMDFMEEAIKEDDKVSLTRLQKFEAKLIKDQQKAANSMKPTLPPSTKASASTCIKKEPLTEMQSYLGNESTKLPADFDLDDDMDEEEEEVFPRPIVIKKDPEQSVKERYNINCLQCEKVKTLMDSLLKNSSTSKLLLQFIDFMGSNLNEEKIRIYLDNCRHIDDRALDNNTPEGFWNPHMVSFDEADPRSKVIVDRRFVDQRKK